jgi:hypothetical protein
MRDALLSHTELLPLCFSILLHDFYKFLFFLSLPVSSRNAFELCSCNAILSLSSHPLALSSLSVSFSNHFLFFSFLFFSSLYSHPPSDIYISLHVFSCLSLHFSSRYTSVIHKNKFSFSSRLTLLNTNLFTHQLSVTLTLTISFIRSVFSLSSFIFSLFSSLHSLLFPSSLPLPLFLIFSLPLPLFLLFSLSLPPFPSSVIPPFFPSSLLHFPDFHSFPFLPPLTCTICHLQTSPTGTLSLV